MIAQTTATHADVGRDSRFQVEILPTRPRSAGPQRTVRTTRKPVDATGWPAGTALR